MDFCLPQRWRESDTSWSSMCTSLAELIDGDLMKMLIPATRGNWLRYACASRKKEGLRFLTEGLLSRLWATPSPPERIEGFLEALADAGKDRRVAQGIARAFRLP